MAEKIIDRVFQYLENKGIPHTRFEKEIGLSNGYLNTQKKRHADLGEKVIQKIIENSLNMNLIWLITGKGNMFNAAPDYPTQTMSIAKEPDPKYQIGIPLLSTEAVAGNGNFSFAIERLDIQARYVVPDFENSDFMIPVKGSSMYPKYNSGDKVACKILKEPSFIQWNKVHVIATKEQGILIKRVKKGSNDKVITVVSDNKDYDPFEIPWEEITGIALVLGVVRLE